MTIAVAMAGSYALNTVWQQHEDKIVSAPGQMVTVRLPAQQPSFSDDWHGSAGLETGRILFPGFRLTHRNMNDAVADFGPTGLLLGSRTTRVHVHCQGKRDGSDPAVFLEAGALGWSSSWHRVQALLSPHAYSCTWDRPGMGWSDGLDESIPLDVYPDLLAQALGHQLYEHHWVLVGHSMGALYMRQFAGYFPDQVAGLVLVDPADPDQFIRLPNPLVAQTRESLKLLRLGPALADMGLLRWTSPPILDFSTLPSDWFFPIYRFTNNGRHLSQSYEEVRQWTVIQQSVHRAPVPYGPWMVISAEYRESREDWTNAWRQLHREMAHLSPTGEWKMAKGVDHQGILFTETGSQTVSSSIRQVIAETHVVQRHQLANWQSETVALH